MKALLDRALREYVSKISYDFPDPLLVAKRYNDEKIALICALFAYGSAKQIVKFLDTLDFNLLQAPDKEILKLTNYYRFQKPLDVANFFITLKRAPSLEDLFIKGYRKEGSVVEGLASLIAALQKLNSYRSYGYDFLLGKVPPLKRIKGVSPYKRWMMYLRWMVRDLEPDMGLWKGVDRADLLIPLDTHTFNVSRKLGLLRRKRYDLAASIELTERLRSFDPVDPVKYDFALYRLGQMGLV